MEILALIFLGLTQGLTEFLPVSSSGHLVLFGQLFSVEETLFVSIILHVATLMSVCIVFRKEILYMLTHPFSEQSLKLVIATIPTCIMALIFMPIVENAFNGEYLFLSFLFTALILFVAERKKEKYPFTSKPLSFRTAIFMGIMQGIAIFPGISRSGTTISAGLFAKTEKNECANFSFLMSVPIILLSLIMEIYNISISNNSISVSWVGLFLSFCIAFIVGIFSIKLMIKITNKSNLKYFSLYLIFIAVISMLLL